MHIHSSAGRESACGGTLEGKSRGPACGDATPGGVQGLHNEEVTESMRRVFIRGKVASPCGGRRVTGDTASASRGRDCIPDAEHEQNPPEALVDYAPPIKVVRSVSDN